MSQPTNNGFAPSTIANYRSKMKSEGKLFWLVEEDGNSDEYVHFYFIGKHAGKEVIFDTVLYTLRLQHESELYEVAENRMAQRFPNYRKLVPQDDENDGVNQIDSMEEEMGLYMAEVILDLQEEEAVKVQEHVDIDENAEFGISLDVGLQVERITPQVIEKFITDFNVGKLELDDTFYSFQIEQEEP